MTDLPADHLPGANKPPPDADPLLERLNRDHAALADEAADLELAAFALPEAPASEEDAALLTDWAAKAKGLNRRIEAVREEEKEPYLTGGRKVDGWAKEIVAPVASNIAKIEGRLNAYQRAKAERERAERLQREREEREAAAEARRVEEEERRKAEEAEREAEAAKAKIRSAADAEERAAAEEKMRQADLAAEEARRNAEQAGKDAVKSDRVADSNARVAAKGPGALAKVTSSGASAGITEFWNHRIKDAEKLVESLGPLGVHLANDAIMQAISKAKREAVSSGNIEALSIPGVEFFKDSQTTVRAARSPKK